MTVAYMVLCSVHPTLDPNDFIAGPSATDSGFEQGPFTSDSLVVTSEEIETFFGRQMLLRIHLSLFLTSVQLNLLLGGWE